MTKKIWTKEKLISEFQCPGCVGGISPKDCDSYKLLNCPGGGFRCSAHVVGTSINCVIHIALGLPKGFCRPQRSPDGETDNIMDIRLWEKGTFDGKFWDNFNIPVWALEQEGFLFVRTVSPRVGATTTDVIEGGKRLELCPNAVDVSKFYDEMD